uniref:Uncharacterized protein n=1 Tax=Oryza punctata TaxID=4537 RepID=A0A0E0JXF7_ORYPU
MGLVGSDPAAEHAKNVTTSTNSDLNSTRQNSLVNMDYYETKTETNHICTAGWAVGTHTVTFTYKIGFSPIELGVVHGLEGLKWAFPSMARSGVFVANLALVGASVGDGSGWLARAVVAGGRHGVEAAGALWASEANGCSDRKEGAWMVCWIQLCNIKDDGGKSSSSGHSLQNRAPPLLFHSLKREGVAGKAWADRFVHTIETNQSYSVMVMAKGGAKP